MELEIYSIVAAAILAATILTAIFTVANYAIFQIRKRRQVARVEARPAAAPQFFRRYEASR